MVFCFNNRLKRLINSVYAIGYLSLEFFRNNDHYCIKYAQDTKKNINTPKFRFHNIVKLFENISGLFNAL